MYLFTISAINVLKRAVFPEFDRAKDTNKKIANKEIVRKVKGKGFILFKPRGKNFVKLTLIVSLSSRSKGRTNQNVRITWVTI